MGANEDFFRVFVDGASASLSGLTDVQRKRAYTYRQALALGKTASDYRAAVVVFDDVDTKNLDWRFGTNGYAYTETQWAAFAAARTAAGYSASADQAPPPANEAWTSRQQNPLSQWRHVRGDELGGEKERPLAPLEKPGWVYTRAHFAGGSKRADAATIPYTSALPSLRTLADFKARWTGRKLGNVGANHVWSALTNGLTRGSDPTTDTKPDPNEVVFIRFDHFKGFSIHSGSGQKSWLCLFFFRF